MSPLAPVLALAGVIIGAVLAYVFTSLVEKRREQWALDRQWRDRKLQAYGAYVGDIERMRDLAQRVAAAVGLDDQAPPLNREAGLSLLAEANTTRSSSFETVNLIGGHGVVTAARELNRTAWRLEWFARGFLDDTDRAGWIKAFQNYHAAVDKFHECARLDLGISGRFPPRSTEPSPRVQYEIDRFAGQPPRE